MVPPVLLVPPYRLRVCAPRRKKRRAAHVGFATDTMAVPSTITTELDSGKAGTTATCAPACLPMLHVPMLHALRAWRSRMCGTQV